MRKKYLLLSNHLPEQDPDPIDLPANKFRSTQHGIVLNQLFTRDMQHANFV